MRKVFAGRGRGRAKAKNKRKKMLAEDTDEESEAGEQVQESSTATFMDDKATSSFTNWSISYRGRWDRWHGKHTLPRQFSKRAARR